MSNSALVKRQAKRWLASNNASPAKLRIDEHNKRLNKLDSEEKRYAKAYGLGYMSERLYKDQMQELIEERTELHNNIAKAEEELGEQPKLSLEQLVDGAQKMLGNLVFTDKKAIIRKLVTKVKATPEEVIIWGQIPILATEQVGLRAEYRYCRFA